MEKRTSSIPGLSSLQQMHRLLGQIPQSLDQERRIERHFIQSLKRKPLKHQACVPIGSQNWLASTKHRRFWREVYQVIEAQFVILFPFLSAKEVFIYPQQSANLNLFLQFFQYFTPQRNI